MNSQNVQEVFDLLVDRPEIRDLLFKRVLPDDWDVLCDVKFRVVTMRPAERAADGAFRN